MNLTALDNFLWAAGFVGHAALLLVLLFRRRWRQFPIFTCFITYEASITIALFFAFRYGSQHSYAVIYWCTAAGDILFQLALIFEIAVEARRPHPHRVVIGLSLISLMIILVYAGHTLVAGQLLIV